jgi:hypothetical protein
MKVFTTNTALNQTNFETLPSGSWLSTSNTYYNSRLDLPYRNIYYNPEDRLDYGVTSSSSRTIKIPQGVDGDNDYFDMTPRPSEAPWVMQNKGISSIIHYFTLGGDTKGFATMAENYQGQPLTRWERLALTT